MDDEFYYLALNVKERAVNECITKFGSLYKAQITLFGNKRCLYRDYSFPKINAILKICQACDVSFDYIITGKNKQPYKPLKETYNNLIKEYSNNRHTNQFDNSANVILCRLRRGKQTTLTLPNFIKFTHKYRKLPSYLVE